MREAADKPKCNEREIAKAYRRSWTWQAYQPDFANLFEELKSKKHYPNSAELAADWTGSKIIVARSSWREQLNPDGVLACPNHLDSPWLFSMDPMTYLEASDSDDANLHRSDLDPLIRALKGYVDSGQPGIASLFVYSVGSQGENRQLQFWAFMDELTESLSVESSSYWVCHRGGNRNLAGLLFANTKFPDDFVPPCINAGRGI